MVVALGCAPGMTMCGVGKGDDGVVGRGYGRHVFDRPEPATDLDYYRRSKSRPSPDIVSARSAWPDVRRGASSKTTSSGADSASLITKPNAASMLETSLAPS